LRYSVKIGKTYGAERCTFLGRSNKAISALKIFEETAHCGVSVLGGRLGASISERGVRKGIKNIRVGREFLALSIIAIT